MLAKELEKVKKVIRKMPKYCGCHGNCKSVKLRLFVHYIFRSHRKSNAYISYLNYVQLYETLHLEMAAHFQKVTETGPSLKQVLLRNIISLKSESSSISVVYIAEKTPQ